MIPPGPQASCYLNHSFSKMTAVTHPKTFADLCQDATKDPFGTLATPAKRAAYQKIYAYFNADENKGIMPEASATLTALRV